MQNPTKIFIEFVNANDRRECGNPLKVFLSAKEKIMIELSNQPLEPAKLREEIIKYCVS